MPETNKTSVNHKKLFSMMMFTPFDLTERNNKAFSASFSALDTIMIKRPSVVVVEAPLLEDLQDLSLE